MKIDTVLTYCHYSMNDTSLQDHLDYFQVIVKKLSLLCDGKIDLQCFPIKEDHCSVLFLYVLSFSHQGTGRRSC